MNRKNFIFKLVVIFTFFFGCGDDKKETESDYLRIAKDLTGISFNEKSNEGVIGVLSNTSWSLTVSGGSWISCNPTSGEGSVSVVVSVDPNVDPPERSASITITSQGGAFTHHIAVTQLGTEPNIILSPTMATAPDAGGDVEVTVTATNTWTVQMPSGGWVDVKSQDGSKVVFKVEPNEEDDEREGTITFTLDRDGNQASLVITQPCIPWILPEMVLPDEAVVGTNINISGTGLLEINEVWFGNTKGVIEEEERTNSAMVVTISGDATLGEVDVKIFFGDKGRNRVIGSINLLSPRPVINDLPEFVTIGGGLVLTGTNFDLIDEVWFGDVQGTIEAGRTDVSMTVTIPVTASEGEVDLKIIYLGSFELTVGQIKLMGADCDPERNLTLFAGSTYPGAPDLTFQNNSNFNTGGRQAKYAFDGVFDGATYDAFKDNYDLYYFSGTQNLTGLGITAQTGSNSNTYWQGGSSGQAVGEVADGGTTWLKLNYSSTSGYSKTNGFVTFDKIVMHNRNGSAEVLTFTIEVSDDDSNWVKIVPSEKSFSLDGNRQKAHTIELDEPVTAKFVRFVVVSTNGGVTNVGISCFKLYNTGCQ